jgi:DNA-binding transcriptional LysR family regulator
MDKLVSMQIFMRVAEMASFTKAGETLGLPKASISTHVQDLESLIGTRLLNRTTRKVQLTHDGQIFYERCKDLLSEVDEIESMFHEAPENLTGRLRVDMPNSFAKNLFVPKLPEFLKLHPGLEIELSSTDRRVDVIREGFDCVLRVGNLTDSSLMSKRLGSLKIINCVSPSYIERFGKPKNLDDLVNHRLIHYVPVLGARPEGFEYLDGEKYKMIKMKGQVVVNNADSYTAAALAGLGIIQVPQVGMTEMIESGQLIEVLPKFQAEPMPVSLLYPHRRNLARRLQVFMEWIQEISRDYISS